MDMSETPVEAIVALGYTLTAATSIWTWLAVFTAAVGCFWRLHASSALHLSKHPFSQPQPIPQTQPRHVEVVPQPEQEETPPTTSCHVAACEKGVVFEAFDFWVDEEEESEEEEVTRGEEGLVEGGEWEEEEEEEGKVRVAWRGDLGWYRFQDTKVFSGSVVRLWDDGRRSSPAVRLLRRNTL